MSAMLPNLSYCSLEALDSGGSIFPGDAVDHYLSNLAMSAMLDYVGGSDESGGGYFGTATLIEFDDEDRIVCAVIQAAAYEHSEPDVDAYANVAAVILWGSDQKWWGDGQAYASLDAAKVDYETFETKYGEWLDAVDEEGAE